MFNAMSQGWISRPAIIVGLLMAACFLGGCLFETASPNTDSLLQLDYSVQVGPRGRSDCRIEIQVRNWPKPGSIIFQAPIYYTDNPRLPVKGIQAKDVKALDSHGNALVARDTLIPDLSLNGNFISIPHCVKSLSYSVDFDPPDSNRFGIPVPGTSKGVDLIDGAYFFLLPLVGTDFASQWRTPVDLHLEFLPAAGRTLVGTDAKIVFQSNYGLMFVRAAYDPVLSTSFSLQNHEVTFYKTSSDTMDVPKFTALLKQCINLVEDSIMVLPTYRYFVGENPVFWGVEGSQGYWFKSVAAAMPMVHVHELIHTFVGIYSGDFQDPWYKEGMTDYLGNLLPLQAGMIPESTFVQEMLASHDTVAAVKHFALSSNQVRDHLFSPLDTVYQDVPNSENFIELVYGKGAQASMILDRYILEYSRQSRSVFDLVKDLNNKFGSGFTRRDLVTLVNGYTQQNAEKFLHDLLDFAAPLTQDSLSHTYLALKNMGRFSPSVPAGIKALAKQGAKSTGPDGKF